ncbi:androgen-dependent TFPI-regulating protein-like [Melitaea cinxia]|uniref:androgen-dependent TFPI-regulating protein-like n=1 Tax=Melitaea cinxia TaxID=113334 RepID=UPI001E26FBD6|nr:androgen-dependent TFPI-regulating protein-like [Melitaea cinxia]
MTDTEANLQSDSSESKISKKSKLNLILRTIFHGCCSFLFVFVISWGFMIWITMQVDDTTDDNLRYLKKLTPFFFTNWNFAFQIIFLSLSLLYDALEWLDMSGGRLATKIKYWRDVVFMGLVVPYTLFVTSMFWIVYAIDRELVFPKVYDSVVPWWFNHCVHTNITIVVIIETLLQARRKPADRKVELILYLFIALSYTVVYYTIYFVTGRWLYQVFGVMNWWQVCLYQLLIWGSSFAFYLIQCPINRLIHGSEDNELDLNNTTIENIQTIEKIIQNGNENETDLSSKNSWSLKFRDLKEPLENSRL